MSEKQLFEPDDLKDFAKPSHIKRFAETIGQRAKTDKLDAQLIAHYGEAIQPKFSQLKPGKM